MTATPTCSIVIPSYNREEVLVDTISALLDIMGESSEIIVVDQTVQHQDDTKRWLEKWNEGNFLEWIRQSEPSIPKAMNRGAIEGRGELLLFLDDDIIPDANLVKAHLSAHSENADSIVAGRVLQPWHKDKHSTDAFTRLVSEPKEEFMGGNFSIRRDVLLATGGFDENFKGAAYRFEREFADRILGSGGTIRYEPSAVIRHLHAGTGGTRAHGDHLRSWNPSHPVGAYYYLLVSKRVKHRWGQMLGRILSSIKTKHHLKRPWYIPVTLASELLGLGWAVGLRLKGPQLLARQQL